MKYARLNKFITSDQKSKSILVLNLWIFRISLR